jgi:tight adherence protein C
MLLVFVFACATAVVGLTLVVRGALGVTAPLATIADDLRRPRTPEAASLSLIDRLLARLAGVPSAERSADLAVCDRTEDWFVQQRFVWALLASLPGLGLFAISTWGVEMFFPAPLLLAASAAGLVVGWFYARVDLRSDADKARREFRHSLAAYLELVTILMSGGAGVETSMFDAAALGRGSAFRHLRSALSAAHARRDPPWFGLGQLGSRIGVSELEELEASMTLAGGGAQVRDSLAAKAAAMRMRDLADFESEAQARSETMVLPVALMFAGFLVLIGYPALAALSGP